MPNSRVSPSISPIMVWYVAKMMRASLSRLLLVPVNMDVVTFGSSLLKFLCA